MRKIVNQIYNKPTLYYLKRPKATDKQDRASKSILSGTNLKSCIKIAGLYCHAILNLNHAIN